jgi:hypothetical protein
MQPKPRDERLVVDPRPGTGTGNRGRIMLPKPNPKAKKKPGTGQKVPNPGMGTDDRIYRTMPITQSQLTKIKNMYGIK